MKQQVRTCHQMCDSDLSELNQVFFSSRVTLSSRVTHHLALRCKRCRALHVYTWEINRGKRFFFLFFCNCAPPPFFIKTEQQPWFHLTDRTCGTFSSVFPHPRCWSSVPTPAGGSAVTALSADSPGRGSTETVCFCPPSSGTRATSSTSR